MLGKILSGVLLIFSLFCCIQTAFAQQRFKVGDLVEVRYVGEMQKGVIVEGYQQTEFGYGTYKIHLDGEKYCNNHVLDTRINANFVFPRQGSTPTPANNSGSSNNSSGDYNNNSGNSRVTKPAVNKSWTAQKFKTGGRVMYSDGYILWGGPGVITEIDAEKRLYTVRDVKDPSWRYSYPCFAVFQPGQINNEFYVGSWDVQITGATSTFTHNGKVYRQFSGGVKLPPLEVKADGTYLWRISANQSIRGTWEDREGVPGITLLKAIDGKDYTLYEKTEAFATTAKTRDEIGITHLPSGTGYFMAYRIGENKSCVLAGRTF